MIKFKQHATAAVIGLALIASFGYAPAASAAIDGPAPIETGSGPRDTGASIDDGSGPRATVTEDNPYGAGVAPQSGSGPRKVGAEIQSGGGPRPVGKPVPREVEARSAPWPEVTKSGPDHRFRNR